MYEPILLSLFAIFCVYVMFRIGAPLVVVRRGRLKFGVESFRRADSSISMSSDEDEQQRDGDEAKISLSMSHSRSWHCSLCGAQNETSSLECVGCGSRSDTVDSANRNSTDGYPSGLPNRYQIKSVLHASPASVLRVYSATDIEAGLPVVVVHVRDWRMSIEFASDMERVSRMLGRNGASILHTGGVLHEEAYCVMPLATLGSKRLNPRPRADWNSVFPGGWDFANPKEDEEYRVRPVHPSSILKFIRETGQASADEIASAFEVQRPMWFPCGGIGLISGPEAQRSNMFWDSITCLMEADIVHVGYDESGQMQYLLESSKLAKIADAIGFGLSELERAAFASHRNEAHTIVGRQWSEMDSLSSELRVNLPSSVYREDLIASINEMAVCMRSGCYIAVMSIAGKVLEICLKQALMDAGVAFDDSWMLGTLLKKTFSDASNNVYIDPSLRNVATIIATSRIPAVHALTDVPIPSQHQASMVAHATIDTVRRLLLCGQSR